jgi:hypothetical protein
MKFRTFAAAWLMLAGALAGCKNTNEPEPNPLPATVYACESNTAELCAYWNLDGTEYHAEWPDGARAVIRVERFDADSAVFWRTDKPLSTSAGMTAVYRGQVRDRSVTGGRVTWSEDGLTISGTWTADW